MAVLNFYKIGLVIPENAVYIGRKSYKHGLPESKFHNPFPLVKGEPRGSTIDKYRTYLWNQIKSGKITIEDLLELDGKDLVCYCHPNPCHGDVLTAAINWAKTIKED